MKRKARTNRHSSVPNARYRRRHRDGAEMPPPAIMARRRNVVFVDGESRS